MKKRIIAMVMVLLLLALPALADERIDLSTEGCDQFVDNLALPDGRVVFAGSAAVKGNYQDARARLLCLNPDGSVAWEYIHPAQGKCSFGNLELLPEGVLGVIMTNSPEQNTTEKKIMRFSLDGQPAGEPIDIYTEDISGCESTPTCITFSVIPGDAQTFYRYYMDWDGNIYFRINADSTIGGSNTMLPTHDGILLTGTENGYPSPAKAVKLDLYGSVAWETVLPTYFPEGNASFENAIPIADGGCIAWLRESGGDLLSDEMQHYRALVRLDANGVVLWQTQVTPDMFDSSRCEAIGVYQEKIVVAMPGSSYNGDEPYIYLWFDMSGTYLGKTSNRLNVGEVNYGANFVELDGELWVKKDIKKNFDDLMDEMDSCDEILIKVPVI